MMSSSPRQAIDAEIRPGAPDACASGNDGRPTTNHGSPSFVQEGQLLDNTYRIVRLIGEGGMGLVYEATHARLAGRYAIKVILKGLSGSLEASARFDREARITSWLQHPNIVQVIDFNRLADGTEYLVMEYLQGETLADRLQTGALPHSSVVSIIQQISSALAAAHSHGIVHRDLKPANVFLLPVEGSSVELVKVLDFGISKVHDATDAFRGVPSGLMGTPQYMAPEQCRGQGAAMDGASDQFSLAVLTFETLTGRSPFFSETVGGALMRVLYEEAPAMGLDPKIEEVVHRGLAKAPQDRFPSVIAFASALQAAIGDDQGAEGVSAPSGSPIADVPTTDAIVWARSPEPARSANRRRWRWTIALAAVASIAVLLGVCRDGGLGTRLFRRSTPMVLLADVTQRNDARVQLRRTPPLRRYIIPVESRPIADQTPPERALSGAALARYRRHHQRARYSAPTRTAMARQQAPRGDGPYDENGVLPLSVDPSP